MVSVELGHFHSHPGRSHRAGDRCERGAGQQRGRHRAGRQLRLGERRFGQHHHLGHRTGHVLPRHHPTRPGQLRPRRAVRDRLGHRDRRERQHPWRLGRLDVKGVIAPQLHFEIKLPETGWQANYLQVGCGGLCGNTSVNNAPASAGCVPLTTGAFAVASSDEGHYQGGGLFSTDPTLRADFGYKSDHELLQAAKAVIQQYYGQAATHSYFDGCSQGGHQALTEAQRYPTDFDGIIAGAPANNFTALNTFSHAWTAQSVYLSGGPATITNADLADLHKAVLKGCGAPADGIIADPLSCTWDPGTIQCGTGQTSTSVTYCLTPDQVTTLRRIYAGPTDEHGQLLYPGHQLRGSELNWAGIITRPPLPAPAVTSASSGRPCATRSSTARSRP